MQKRAHRNRSETGRVRCNPRCCEIPRQAVPFLLRLQILGQKDQFPSSPPASVEHTSLIKRTVQLLAWHDLSTNQRCFLLSTPKKNLKKKSIRHFISRDLFETQHSFPSSNRHFCHDSTTTGKQARIFHVVSLTSIQF